jgi:hypothetical protein
LLRHFQLADGPRLIAGLRGNDLDFLIAFVPSPGKNQLVAWGEDEAHTSALGQKRTS